MLGHMKSIKMSGLTRRLAATISQMRADEIEAARPFRMIMVSTAALAQVPVLLAPVAAFAAFALVAARTEQTFDATRLFSPLSLVILLAAPLFGTFEIVLNLQSSIACFDRIQKYLVAENRQDRRERRVGTGKPTRERFSSSSPIHSGPASDGNEQYRLERIQNSEINEHKDISFTTDIQLENVSFGWSSAGQPIVNNVNVTVARGEFLVLVGPVASGKSTLLKGLMGETPVSMGKVSVNQVPTSWCEQTPWIKVSQSTRTFVRIWPI
jgi:ATP-binding cassette, subfamily C (CFTR/MRP), member 1